MGLYVCPEVEVSFRLYLSYIFYDISFEKRSWDGYAREMSESGSVYRHGTLRWTYALRSKQPLCLPQCIPNRSDKVPPLCDPDPLLIMDRLQNLPLGGRTGPAHGAAVGAPRRAHWWTHMIWLVNFHALWQPQTDWEQSGVFLSLQHPSKRMWLLDLNVYESDSFHHDSFLKLCSYLNTSKTKNNCQVFDIYATAAMHRIWLLSELFLPLATKETH